MSQIVQGTELLQITHEGLTIMQFPASTAGAIFPNAKEIRHI